MYISRFRSNVGGGGRRILQKMTGELPIPDIFAEGSDVSNEIFAAEGEIAAD